MPSILSGVEKPIFELKSPIIMSIGELEREKRKKESVEEESKYKLEYLIPPKYGKFGGDNISDGNIREWGGNISNVDSEQLGNILRYIENTWKSSPLKQKEEERLEKESLTPPKSHPKGNIPLVPSNLTLPNLIGTITRTKSPKPTPLSARVTDDLVGLDLDFTHLNLRLPRSPDTHSATYHLEGQSNSGGNKVIMDAFQNLGLPMPFSPVRELHSSNLHDNGGHAQDDDGPKTELQLKIIDILSDIPDLAYLLENKLHFNWTLPEV